MSKNSDFPPAPQLRAWYFRLYLLATIELRLLARQQTAWGAALLLVLGGVILVYVSTWGGLVVEVAWWNTIFWLLMFLASLLISHNVVESGTLLHYYLVAPIGWCFGAKALGQSILLGVLSLVLWGVMGLSLGNPVVLPWVFLLGVSGGVVGMGAVGVGAALMGARLEEQPILVSVMGVPLLLPVLLFAHQSTAAGCGLGGESFIWGLWSLVACIGGCIFVILPWIWKS